MRAWLALVLVAAPFVLPVWGAGASPVMPPDLAAAAEQAQRLQDTARVLRNGARMGADAAVLRRQRDRLRAELDLLVQAHERWSSTAPDEQRRRAEAPMADVHQGCDRLRAHLDELDGALAAGPLDRARVQALGQRIGRQAAGCEHALRRASSAAAVVSTVVA